MRQKRNTNDTRLQNNKFKKITFHNNLFNELNYEKYCITVNINYLYFNRILVLNYAYYLLHY